MQASTLSRSEERIRQRLEEKPDGVLETIATDLGVPLADVFACLPAGAAVKTDGSAFEEIWQDLVSWGEITFVVHTGDGVFECKGCLPPGSLGRGFFNIHGDSPIGGHLRADRCRSIYFVDRLFFGRRSCSVQFVNQDGNAMFKVFVGRNEDRSLKAEQVARFEALRDGMAASR